MIAKSKSNSKPRTATLSDAMRKSMLQIWQAGLGAFAGTQRDGAAAFEKLASDGAKLQSRAREEACAGAAEVAESAKRIAGRVGKQATGSWHKVEARLEKGVADALHTLGVPVRNDLQALIDRIEKLSASIEALTSRKAAASKRAVKAPARAAKKLPALKSSASAKGKHRVRAAITKGTPAVPPTRH